MTTLQSAINVPYLFDVAIESWEAFIKTLDIRFIAQILNLTLIILLQNFDLYSTCHKIKVGTILEYLIVDNERHFYSQLPTIDMLPTSDAVPAFQNVNAVLGKYANNSGAPNTGLVNSLFLLCKEGLMHKNALVVMKSLNSLKVQLKYHGESIQRRPELESGRLTSEMMQTLLYVCHRFGGVAVEIQLLSCECIGLIGAVDPSQVYYNKKKEGFPIFLDPFQSPEDTVEFVCHFIEHHLTPAFCGAQSTIMQGHLSFAIQELLKVRQLRLIPTSFAGLHTKSYI